MYDPTNNSTTIELLVGAIKGCAYHRMSLALKHGVGKTLPVLGAVPPAPGRLSAPRVLLDCNPATGLSRSLEWDLTGQREPTRHA